MMVSLAAVPSAAATDGFSDFWKSFQAAVAKNDQDAVRGMTKFPILFHSDERQADAFPEIYKGLFGAKARRCMAKAKPEKDANDGSYDVFCGDTIYIFSKTGSDWRFSDTGEND